MDDMTQRARELLDRRTAISLLATSDPDGRPDVCLLIAARMDEDGQVSGGEEAAVCGNTFRNLRQRPGAHLLVLDPIADPRARDGVRMDVEFLGAEQDGEELGRLAKWLSTFAPGRTVVRRLIFKVHRIEAYRPPDDGPVIAGD